MTKEGEKSELMEALEYWFGGLPQYEDGAKRVEYENLEKLYGLLKMLQYKSPVEQEQKP